MKPISLLIFSLLLSACVSGTFSSHADIEEYPLRPASQNEAARLKKCLKAAYGAQQEHYEKKGSFYRKASDLPVDSLCQGFYLGFHPAAGGHEIMAQFHEGDSTVRWTINPEGVIEEHLDPEINDDLEF